MKFVCLKYVDTGKWKALSGDEQTEGRTDALEYEGILLQSGHFFAPMAPDIAGPSLHLHYRNGQPDAESPDDEEQRESGNKLAGLLFLEARDMNHAISLLSHHPDLRWGAFRIHAADDGETP